MIRFVMAIGAAFLLTDPALAKPAQTAPTSADCEQIRQAVAQYGYAAAKRNALINYGKEAVIAGDRCLTKKDKAAKGTMVH